MRFYFRTGHNSGVSVGLVGAMFILPFYLLALAFAGLFAFVGWLARR